MADTEQPETARPQSLAVIPPPRVNMRTGAVVQAIIPTTIEEVMQIARMAVNGAMAPDSLLKEKGGAWKPFEDAMSACAIAIMAGAEMGLTPLSALRSYAVVNGRPTLWGDGIKAVVRKSGLCEFIKTGSDETKGWCEAKRKDTGEVQRKEFTLVQAKKAGLTEKKGPWKEYPDMMMERRATFRCLNDLFADVLAGIVSAEEASDYSEIPPDVDRRELPPEPPADEPAPVPPADAAGNPAEGTPDEDGGQGKQVAPTKIIDQPAEPPAGVTLDDGQVVTVEEFLAQVDAELMLASDEETIEEVFDSLDVQVKLPDDVSIGKAFEIKQRYLDAVARKVSPTVAPQFTGDHDDEEAPEPPDEDATPRAEGVDDMFPGDRDFPTTHMTRPQK